MLRSLKRGERLGSVGVVAGLAAVAGLIAVLFGVIVWQANRFESFVDVVVSRCGDRLEFDLASQESRKADLAVYEALLERETDPAVREALAWGVEGKQLVLDNPPPGECTEYLERLAAQ